MTELTGGCACGSVRYVLCSEPFDAGYCHCRICQLSSGAPVMAFATVPREDLVVTAGEITTRKSSDCGERGFCGSCGTPLTIHVEFQPATIDFTIATLDLPERVEPGFHIWRGSHIQWFETADEKPRYDGFRPDTVGLSDSAPAAR